MKYQMHASTRFPRSLENAVSDAMTLATGDLFDCHAIIWRIMLALTINCWWSCNQSDCPVHESWREIGFEIQDINFGWEASVMHVQMQEQTMKNLLKKNKLQSSGIQLRNANKIIQSLLWLVYEDYCDLLCLLMIQYLIYIYMYIEYLYIIVCFNDMFF